ncbi:hypothetical protein B0G69_3964 [Paraburkholderia sp. RAU2J]|nr:hypothetical protein B0G69_3964 [Paraburkholderia sp. RAU2J]
MCQSAQDGIEGRIFARLEGRRADEQDATKACQHALHV